MTPTPEALAQAKDIVAFLDAHTCIHSPGCLACMLEERIALALTEQAREIERLRTALDRVATFLDVDIRAWLPNEHVNCGIDSGCAHGAIEREVFDRLENAVDAALALGAKLDR